MRYRQKPVTVIAHLWNGNEDEAMQVGWICDACKRGRIVIEPNGTLHVLNSNMVGMYARSGDYLVMHTGGSIQAVSKEAFAERFEAVL